jgi:hypothetical protein
MKWKLAFIHKKVFVFTKAYNGENLSFWESDHFWVISLLHAFSANMCQNFGDLCQDGANQTLFLQFFFNFFVYKTYFFFFNLVILFWYPNPTCHFVKINWFLFKFYLALATLKKRVVIRIHKQIINHDNYSKLNFRISNFFVKF